MSIRAASSGAIAYALYNRVDGGQKNTVLAGGDIRVEAEGVKEAVWDQGHSDAAVNRVDAAVAVYTHAGSQTLLKAEGDISVKAEVRETEAGAAQGGAFGLYAGKAARLGTDQREVENLLEANRVDVAAFSEGKAYALYADRGGDNAVHGETSGMITASATGDFGEAQALHAHWSGTNSVSAATVEIAASAAGLAGTAYGLFSDGGNNSISAGTAVISATANASSGRAYGLFAQGYGSHNTIKALEGKALAVSITAANAQEAYALWAKNYGAINRISGGDQADSVSIVGEVYAASSGQNIIETGGGNDSISLFGKVTAGALNIIAGDGFDTLILKAASLAEFNDHYKAWLDDLQLKGCIEGMGVERVEVQIEGNAEGNPGVLASELDWLKDCFASSKSIDFVLDCIVSESSAGEGISFVGGTGDDSLYLRLSGGSGDSSLFSSFLENSAISSVENLILDMDDSHTGSLELDSLLEHLPGGKLYVCGDENDAVLLGKSESWQKSDALVTHNGVQYTMYMHESENLEIYIQSSITILG